MTDDIKREIAALPVVQYAFFDVSELSFSEKVRYICKTQCPMYNKSYSCPEAVGSVEECRKYCSGFKRAFIFSTVAENVDCEDMEQMLATRYAHSEMTRKINELFKSKYKSTAMFASEACALCEQCAYPTDKCRHPGEMIRCIESQGILVTDIAEKYGLEYFNGAGTVTWFGLILYNE